VTKRCILTLAWLCSILVACKGGGSNPDNNVKPGGWTPGQVFATPTAPNARGLLDRRGLIHAHSIHSHDACDNAPRDDAGVPDMVCDADFRRGLCQSRHDFVFLTDHTGQFDETEFPETLLYRPDAGDMLVERGGEPVANWAGCPDGSRALIMAGCESESMPVGLLHHIPGRGSVYGSLVPADLLTQQAHGAVSLVAHTENYTPDQLANLPLQGFEMFNLHANTFLNAGTALVLLNDVGNHEPDMIHPDLVFAALITEDPRYLQAWADVMSRGARRVTTMGTDCHRNTFKQLLADGERVDSYRRMMLAFSNHLLVRPKVDGTWADEELKDALRAGRLYGAFEFLGYPRGFDFTAQGASAVGEMGDDVALGTGVTLKVAMPSVQDLDPSVDTPLLTARVLRATSTGWVEVATGNTSLEVPVSMAGAYRAEVRMKARHLRALLGYDRAALVEKDLVWIYSNAIHITE
jgi:hypothetical protein